MRDIKLARRQLFTGTICFAIACIAGYFIVKPQYLAYQTHKILLDNTVKGIYLGEFNNLPVVSMDQVQPWKNIVLNKFKYLSISTQAKQTYIDIDIKNISQSEKLSRIIKKIPITLKLSCSYSTFKNFIQVIKKDFPVIAIQSVEFNNKKSSTDVKNSEWDIIVHLDLYVISEY